MRLAVACVGVCLALVASRSSSADDWPQWFGPQRDNVWRETGLLEKFPEGGPNIRWRIPIGIGYSGPAVKGDRVYVMDLDRAVDENGQPKRATRQGLPGSERVLCLGAADGKLLWQREYDCPYTISYPGGPRTTPVVDGDWLYTLGAMGDLACQSAADGKVRWSKKLLDEYKTEVPVWGYAAHPLIDGDKLISLVGGQNSAVVAFDKHTGKEIWKSLSTEEVGYSPPMIYELSGKRQLIIWLSEAIYGLDPETGKQLWKQEYPVGVPPMRPAVNIVTVANPDSMLFISSFYHGPMMLKLDGDTPSIVWKGKSNNAAFPDGVHSMMASPVFHDGHGYAVGNQGELRCFETATGKQKWRTYDAVAGKRADGGTVFVVPQGKRHVMFNDQGDLILANLSPEGYQEIDRAHILEPVSFARGRNVVWSHPAFAQRCMFARNDKEMVCVSLAQEG